MKSSSLRPNAPKDRHGPLDAGVHASTIPLVALVGNPNTGKTSVFNMLTGAHHRVSNYPGVTVDRVTGRLLGVKNPIELLDLPGTYSLAARSPDEMIVTDSLLGRQQGGRPFTAVVVVVDAANLDRNLFLVTQILETNLPIVVVLNMMDVAERHGVTIDVDRLSQRLGVPVVPIVARHGQGRQALVDAIETSLTAAAALPVCPWPAPFEHEVAELDLAVRHFSADGQGLPLYEVRRCLLDVGGYAEKRLLERFDGAATALLAEKRNNLTIGGTNLPSFESELRYAWIGEVVQACVRRTDSEARRFSERVDDFLTHRLLGTVIFVTIMGAIFISVFMWSEPLMNTVSDAFGWIQGVIHARLGEGLLTSFLADGIVAGVGGVLIFLPQIMILIGLVTILEDSGYLARAAFLMDRVLRVVGLGGRSFVPLLASFACAIPGIMAARTVENPRERLITILVAPLMSCSARIPIYTILVAAFVPAVTVAGFLPLQGLVFASMYFFGVVVAAIVAVVLRKTVLRGEGAPFLMELPTYKMPSLRTVLLRMCERGKDFVFTAGTIILAMSVIIWALSYFPRPAGVGQRERTRLAEAGITDETAIDHAVSGAYLRQSYLGRMGHGIEPIVKPLGWDWKIGMATLAAFPAREVFISTIAIIYNLGPEEDAESEALRDNLKAATWADGRPVYSTPVALSLMAFFALCCQCQATVAVIKRETRSWGWAIFVFFYMTTLAYVAALVVYQVGSRIA